MAEEQGTPVSQDPAQTVAPAAAPVVPQVGPSPWQQSLQAAFSPEVAAQVDAWARSNVQPYVTQQEQQRAAAEARYAETEGARQMLEAFNTDAEAANVAVNRQLYGNEYADQLAASLGRTDLLVTPPAQQQQFQQVQPQQPQQADPRFEQMYAQWAEDQAQKQYTEAKASFLSDPQYGDIDPELFDPFVGAADTWEEAVNTYRSWAAHYAERNAPAVQTQLAPPTIGSETGGAPGSTPAVPHESLNDAIDAIFSEQKPLAPPVMGQ